MSRRMRTHGKRYTRLYSIYTGMKKRCYDKKHIAYAGYGGKGITICAVWLESFQTFYDWAIKAGYSDGLTIDRIDNDLGYCPENCRWVTYRQQANNKRDTIYIRYRGEVHTTSEWADIFGVTLWCMQKRVSRHPDIWIRV